MGQSCQRKEKIYKIFNNECYFKSIMTKTIFSTEEIPDAVEELVRLRLVENWTGCLNLETDGKQIFVTQYPDSNSWMDGCVTLYSVEEHQDWDDFFDINTDDEEGEEWEKMTPEQKWDEVNRIEYLTEAFSNAQEKFDEEYA